MLKTGCLVFPHGTKQRDLLSPVIFLYDFIFIEIIFEQGLANSQKRHRKIQRIIPLCPGTTNTKYCYKMILIKSYSRKAYYFFKSLGLIKKDP